jgi:thiamine monophosphate kinase
VAFPGWTELAFDAGGAQALVQNLALLEARVNLIAVAEGGRSAADVSDGLAAKRSRGAIANIAAKGW